MVRVKRLTKKKKKKKKKKKGKKTETTPKGDTNTIHPTSIIRFSGAVSLFRTVWAFTHVSIRLGNTFAYTTRVAWAVVDI